MKNSKEDHSEEVRAKWPRHPGDTPMECGCGRLFGADDLLKCDNADHGDCPGHCPFCGQVPKPYRGGKIGGKDEKRSQA